MRCDRRRGFALPAVLAVTGVVTLIFLVAITALTSLTNEARSTRERVKFLESALTAEAALQYLAATEPLNGQGLNVGGPRNPAFGDDLPPAVSSNSGMETLLHLDGRPYEIDVINPNSHPVLVSVRDQAGMINLAALSDQQYLRFGRLISLPGTLTNDIRALYTDYIDSDDLASINGAERSRYNDGGPANRFMLRSSEFLSILGVRQAAGGAPWRAVQDDLVIDTQRPAINLNTASARALRVLFEMSDAQAEAAVRARERAPFLSLADFIAASGANISDDGEQIFTFPAGAVVYFITDTRSAWRYRARLILTPTGNERPFWVDQSEMTEASGTAMASVDADRFPYPSR